MQIMSREHNMLKRQALILKAGTHPLTDQDRARLKVLLRLPRVCRTCLSVLCVHKLLLHALLIWV